MRSFVKSVFLAGVFMTLSLSSGFVYPQTASLWKFNIAAAYYPPNQEGYGIHGGFSPVNFSIVPGEKLSHRSDDPGRDVGSTWGGAEAKASISRIFTVSFLKGEGALFSGNKLELNLTGELSPVSVNAVGEVSLTPIAFLKLSTGAGIGTGWSLLGFNGLGRNIPAITNNAILSEPFSGAVYRFWISSTLQFDFAAFFPGDWNHVVLAFVPKLEYRALTSAGSGIPWQYEADDGDDLNGWKIYTTSVAGYQMPFFVDFAGFLVETDGYSDGNKDLSPLSSGGWGSDFVKINFGPLAEFKLSGNSSLTLLVQFKTARDADDATIGNRFYQYRKIEGTYIYFNRIAFSFGKNF